MTTSAQAEGAIDGTHTDYKLAGAFATTFAFSHYHETAEGQPPTHDKRTATTADFDGDAKRWLARAESVVTRAVPVVS